MFPVLIWLYARLARAEEKVAEERFGAEYDRYRAVTGMFLPVGSPLRLLRLLGAPRRSE